MGQTFSELFPPATKFMPDVIPDLTGKVAVVTGGNTGIGFVTCKYLLLHNARVYMFCRTAVKAEEAIAHLKDITKKDDIHFIACDLADLPSIKRAADEFKARESRLDMLFNSGGVMVPPMDQLTKQGYDLQFGTNTVGHGVLTLLLLPTLLRTVPLSSDGLVRVMNTSSNAHAFAPKGGIDWESGPERDGKLTQWSAYGQSKWANIVFAKELDRRHGKEGVLSVSLMPGAIRTDLQRHQTGPSAWINTFLLHDADPHGALTQLYAGTMPEAANLGGKYLIPWARVGAARRDTDDEGAAKMLWALLETEAASL